ncbi:MAG: class I SAM-dependent methyltransferase [bacterium]|nr:class I SAM-dependent methyltransferase [bacterium]
MPWTPDDWHDWLDVPNRNAVESPSINRTLFNILDRIPARSDKTVADLGCGWLDALPDLVEQFESVVVLGDCARRLGEARLRADGTTARVAGERLDDLRAWTSSFDVVLAVDTIPVCRSTTLTRILQQIHGTLVEGGIFLATFDASSRDGSPYTILGSKRQSAEPGPLHEVELQYRLRCSGFQGLRLRRLDGKGTGAERLLCMAVRRANN